ncbi:glucan biosynthesis protein [Uliginosibacterium sp. H1]|uniref:glucan biosynthesis protein n=1 Tax=Uliginosibacterium sp. H1 TaxID=3114757 RepID=UPI002E19C622|nr:glucan biosynthesis protein G [Uliginosibacterium sp. H1]
MDVERMIGRWLLPGLLLGLMSWAQASQNDGALFDQIANRARTMATKPYQSPADNVPAALKALTYDQYRDIRFNPSEALWRKEGLPFEAMFFHRGKFALDAVKIHEIVDGKQREVPFNTRLFNYGKNKLSTSGWGDIGYAGLRVHYPLNNQQYKDELVVFLGASYFRALGGGQIYGLSARGLAIDTVGGKGEEFPRFTEFWLERPARDARSITVHALLDSPSVAGAYRFVLNPGDTTVVDVKARIFLRKPVATLGIAPLTSMFLAGENQPPKAGFRPEIHDSDGLSIHTAEGEWIWRPLFNPPHILTTSFQLKNPRGFGLMQRDRAFANYEDLEARYEKRPSAWIEPVGDWGSGRVELVQLDTPDETNDNVVAYWVPAQQPAPGTPLDIAYRLHMQGDRGAGDSRPASGWTVQSRRGAGFQPLAEGEDKFVIDFAGPALQALPADAAVDAVIEASAGVTIAEQTVFRNDVTGGWRLAFRYTNTNNTKKTQPVELRVFLKHSQDTVSETWNAIIPPPR